MSSQVKQDLEKAMEILDERDWCQNKFQAPDGVCAKGAIMVAVGYEFDEEGYIVESSILFGTIRRMEATRVLGYAVPEDIRAYSIASLECPVAHYNDMPTTTVEDVKLMFKRAIESCDE